MSKLGEETSQAFKYWVDFILELLLHTSVAALAHLNVELGFTFTEEFFFTAREFVIRKVGVNTQVALVICLPMQETERCRFDLWVRKFWRKAWQPTPVFLPGESDRLQSVGLQRDNH